MFWLRNRDPTVISWSKRLRDFPECLLCCPFFFFGVAKTRPKTKEKINEIHHNINDVWIPLLETGIALILRLSLSNWVHETRFSKDLRNQNCDIMNNVNIDNSESSEDGQSLQNGTKSRRYFYISFVFRYELFRMFYLKIIIDGVENWIVFDWCFENDFIKKDRIFLQILPKLLFHLLSKSALFIFEMNQAKTFDNYSINS